MGPRGLERLALGEDPDPQHGAGPQPPLDVRDAALGEHLAAVHDRDARAQLLELGQDVARDEDRLAERAQLAQELAQLHPGPRVEAGGRLVEEQHRRVVDEGVGQAQPLLHAARQALDVRVALLAQVDELEEVADHPPAARGRQAVAAGEEVEVLPDLHVVVHAEDVGHEPDDPADRGRIVAHRGTGDLRVAVRGAQERREHPQRRGLPGPVRADEPEDLARLDVQVDAGHGDRAVVALGEALGRDDRAHWTVPSSWIWNEKPTPFWSPARNRTRTVPEVGST